MDKRDDNKNQFLEEVAAQIAYKPLRPSVLRESEEHIQDRAEEYGAEGLSAEAAEQKAVAAMGDAVTIGTEINAVRHVRTNRPLAIVTSDRSSHPALTEILPTFPSCRRGGSASLSICCFWDLFFQRTAMTM